jgi:dihydroorotate dehydrogenase (NAD+) catalytic subunit
MLHAVARIAAARGLEAEVSLDPWMGCGIGTCLGCVVRVQGPDEERWKYRCACTEGPVFDGGARGVAGRGGLAGAAGVLGRRGGPPVNLAVEIAGVRLKNPLVAASGTFGYGVEYEGVLDLSLLGGIVSKGLYMEPRDGAPPPRIVETPSGSSTRSACRGWGSARSCATCSPASRGTTRGVRQRLRRHRRGVRGGRPGLRRRAGHRRPRGQHLLPQREKGGLAFGGDPRMTHEVVAAVRKATRLPVIPKLSPNVGDITVFARAAEEAGADALACINTLLGLAIDVETRRPRLGFGTGGLSGPAIRPVAVRMAWQAARAVRIPVIGIGGVACASDALEFLRRRLPGRAGRHRELRRPRGLRAHPRRPPRLPRAPRRSTT